MCAAPLLADSVPHLIILGGTMCAYCSSAVLVVTPFGVMSTLSPAL